MNTTYYETLEVSELASLETIQAAYRSLSKRFHPDVNSQSEERFKRIAEAYEVLSDSDKRRGYDLYLEEERKPKAQTQAPMQEATPMYDPTPHVNTLMTLGTALLMEHVSLHPMVAHAITAYQPDIEKLAVSALRKVWQ